MTAARALRLRLAAEQRIGHLRCVLDHLEDRGNRAAILRTCEALGILHVHEIAPSEPDRGRARGVAGGGEKWLYVHTHTDANECRLSMPGVRILAALPPMQDAPASESWHSVSGKRNKRKPAQGDDDASEADRSEMQSATRALAHALGEPVALEAIDFSQPTALVFGNERFGICDELLALCDGAFYIPLYGLTESLNVSVTAAIAMHFGRLARVTALRESGTLGPQRQGDLTEQEVTDLVRDYESRGKMHAKGNKTRRVD